MPNFFSNITVSSRMTRQESHVRFDSAWDSLSVRFFKFECQQFYNEGAASPYHDFLAGDFDSFVRKLVDARREDAPFFEQAKARGTSFVRIHAINEPVSDYLKFEFYSYCLSELLGERILVVDHSQAEMLAGGTLKDFQLFDDHTLLVQDVVDGTNVGVVESNDAADIARTAQLAHELESIGRGFRDAFPLEPALEHRLIQTFRS
jgi:hypothetical protein